jgi:hypothetical protein
MKLFQSASSPHGSKKLKWWSVPQRVFFLVAYGCRVCFRSEAVNYIAHRIPSGYALSGVSDELPFLDVFCLTDRSGVSR